MLKAFQCLCVLVSAHAKHLWYAVLEGKELHLTPDVLAGIYQCNISHLDNPQIQTSNPDLRQALSRDIKIISQKCKKEMACNRLRWGAVEACASAS